VPKKKLTKTQVKKKLASVTNALYDLTLDKLAYGSAAFTGISFDKLKKMHADTLRALQRAKGK